MAYEFNLPDIGEGVTEGEIVQWLVAEGDTVEEDQAIVEIMTDKATVEIASPVAGVIAKKGIEEGEMLKVGAMVALINESNSSGSAKEKSSSAEDQKTAETADHSESASPKTQPASQTKSTDKESGKVLSLSSSNQDQAQSSDDRMVLASPATRKLARENGIALSQIPASGDNGRLLKQDVEAFLSQAPTAAGAQATALKPIPQSSTTTEQLEERIAVRGIRKIIVENMRKSLDTAAHFTHVDELDASALVAARESLKKEAEAYGVKLTYLPFIIKALCQALKNFPKLNGSLDESAQEIVMKKYYNIGVAVATKDDDLIVPVIKNADQKGLLQISSELLELADKARQNKLSPSDLKDGTFTITSMGKFGGLMATPIINQPQLGILGVHKIEDRVVVREGEMVIRPMANLSLSLDHRVVDGYLGAQFLVDLIELLENPTRLLL